MAAVAYRAGWKRRGLIRPLWRPANRSTIIPVIPRSGTAGLQPSPDVPRVPCYGSRTDSHGSRETAGFDLRVKCGVRQRADFENCVNAQQSEILDRRRRICHDFPFSRGIADPGTQTVAPACQ